MANDLGFSMPDDLPKLVIQGGGAQAVLDALSGAMAHAGAIFKQGDGPTLRGVIVTELSDKHRSRLASHGIDVPAGLLLPVPLTVSHVQDFAETNFLLTKVWRNPKTGEFQDLPTDFPPALAKRLIESRLETLRPLRGIAYAPILRADGTIVRMAGYDAASQLWIAADTPPFTVPDQPDKADAQAAYAVLRELLVEHPFETAADRVAAIGFLMAPALRASMSRVPMLIADAPYGRTGKDYLLATAALIGTGRPPVIFSLSENREEQQKRIGTALLLGAAMVSLNNLNGTLRSDELCAYLTEGGCVTRAYATTGGAKFAPNGNVLAASGNNIVLGGDLPERVFIARQDAQMDFPGERTFVADPHRMVREDRGKYLGAVFTIARWAIRGGERHAGAGLGGFDQFNALIRSPLLALTGEDPAQRSRRELAQSRLQRSERQLIDTLATLFAAEEPFCVRGIGERLASRAIGPGEADPWAELREKPATLGYRLRRALSHRGSDVRLVQAEKPTGGVDAAWFALVSLHRENPQSAQSPQPEPEPPAPWPGSQPPDELPPVLRWMAEAGEFNPAWACPECHCCYLHRGTLDCVVCNPKPPPQH